MNKAVCYIRVSTQEQANEGISLKVQKERLLAYCHLNNLESFEVLKEEGVSAAKPLSLRPMGQKLIELTDKKRVNHIITLKLDRLFRDAEDALHQTKKWDKAGIALHLVDMGGQTINTASAMGRFFLNMMAGFAELERNLISERTSSVLAYKKFHFNVYSPVPYGFNREKENIVKNFDEIKVIKYIKRCRKRGLSYTKIAKRLNDRKIKTKKESKWYASTVWYIVHNKLYNF